MDDKKTTIVVLSSIIFIILSITTYSQIIYSDRDQIQTRITNVAIYPIAEDRAESNAYNQVFNIRINVTGEIWNPTYHPIKIKDYNDCKDHGIEALISNTIFEGSYGVSYNAVGCSPDQPVITTKTYNPGVTTFTAKSSVHIVFHQDVLRPIGNFSIFLNNRPLKFIMYKTFVQIDPNTEVISYETSPSNWGSHESYLMPILEFVSFLLLCAVLTSFITSSTVVGLLKSTRTNPKKRIILSACLIIGLVLLTYSSAKYLNIEKPPNEQREYPQFGGLVGIGTEDYPYYVQFNNRNSISCVEGNSCLQYANHDIILSQISISFKPPPYDIFSGFYDGQNVTYFRMSAFYVVFDKNYKPVYETQYSADNKNSTGEWVDITWKDTHKPEFKLNQESVTEKFLVSYALSFYHVIENGSSYYLPAIENQLVKIDQTTGQLLINPNFEDTTWNWKSNIDYNLFVKWYNPNHFWEYLGFGVLGGLILLVPIVEIIKFEISNRKILTASKDIEKNDENS